MDFELVVLYHSRIGGQYWGLLGGAMLCGLD